MDWLYKALFTAVVALLVLAAARRCGPRLAGVMAALPTATAPAIGWLVHDQGVPLAISAAIANVSVCAMLAAFALAYAIAARRAGPKVALLAGASAAVLMGFPALAAAASLGNALLLASACCALVYLVMPRPDIAVRPVPCTNRRMAIAAAAIGLLAALAAACGPTLGGFATGLLSSLPLIGATVVVMAHAAGGHRAVAQFLCGYVRGLFGKIVFGVVFVVLVRQVGGPIALALACASAVLAATARRPSWTRVAWA